MKYLFTAFIIFLALSTNAQKSPLSSAEKTAHILDSLAKEYNIKDFSVYVHAAETKIVAGHTKLIDPTNLTSLLVGEYSNWRFDGQFVIFLDNADPDAVRYYNLEKMVHFTATKGKNIRIYFQM
jgi:hypothetical protein